MDGQPQPDKEHRKRVHDRLVAFDESDRARTARAAGRDHASIFAGDWTLKNTANARASMDEPSAAAAAAAAPPKQEDVAVAVGRESRGQRRGCRAGHWNLTASRTAITATAPPSMDRA